jgi:hypothetical protein
MEDKIKLEFTAPQVQAIVQALLFRGTYPGTSFELYKFYNDAHTAVVLQLSQLREIELPKK